MIPYCCYPQTSAERSRNSRLIKTSHMLEAYARDLMTGLGPVRYDPGIVPRLLCYLRPDCAMKVAVQVRDMGNTFQPHTGSSTELALPDKRAVRP